jgi:3-oxoadipate enol-lactonase
MTEPDRELLVTGARLRFRDEGAGTAVLLIHGWTLDLDMWEPQARELRDSLRIIRYDRRGFGLSSGHPSLSHDVTDILALCDHLRLQPVALVGMSQGARVAAHVAAGHPGLVSHVILDGAPGGIVLDDPVAQSDIPIATYRELARSGGPSEFLKEWRKHPLTQLHTRDAGSQELLQRMLARYRAEDLSAADAPAPLPSVRADSIRAPALVISGALDLETRIRAADGLARYLPASERAIVPEAGHMPNLDNPPVYNTLLRQFLVRPASTGSRN